MAGCSCKKSPIQKLDMRIRSWGWNGLTPSYLRIADEFIQKKLGVLPTDMEDRQRLYQEAKNK